MDRDEQPVLQLGDLIVEQNADAIIYSNRQGMIERWNAAATAMFGYTAREALGQSLDLIIPEHLRAVHWRGFEAAMASGTTRLHGRPTLTRAQHMSGSRLYVEMSFALVADAAGAVLGAVVIVRDVTERMERERMAAKGVAQGKP